jgi:hypothetical protein
MQTAATQYAEAWKDFFTTAAGASAALAGLVIVAISVNVQRILEQPQLPSRGGATVAALVLILVASMAALIPQPDTVLAFVVSASAVMVWLLQLWSARQIIVAYRKGRRELHKLVIAIAIGQIQVIPFIIGGILCALHPPTGMYWIAWGIVVTFIYSVFTTWVLLVEILR